MDSIDPEKLKTINPNNDKNEANTLNNQKCEVCSEPKNLITCETCRNSFHMRCINLKTIPNKFDCSECIHNSINNETKLSGSPPSNQDPKINGSLNKLNSFELKQRSSKKDLLGYTNTKKPKRERDLGANSFTKSFSYREGFDKEFESSLLNKDRGDKVFNLTIKIFHLFFIQTLSF